jgi:rod shape determining protein RodA
VTSRLFLRRLDYVLLAAVAGIATIGWITVASATRGDIPSSPDYYATRQAAYLVVGALVALGLSLVEPKLFRRLLVPIYGVTVALLLVVLLISSSDARGSSRWIPLPFFNLQPSEIGKLAIIVCLAAVVAEGVRERPGSWLVLARAVALVAPVTLLVFVQPDLGTSIVYGAVTLTILFVAGARLVQFASIAAALGTLVGLVMVVLPALGVHVLAEYQRDRLTTFMNPSQDVASSGYQVWQSLIAVGSGGLTGKGTSEATQSAKGFLPEDYTDFVFAVVAEQRGFVGVALVLGLYVLVVWRAIRSITLAATLFEALVAAGIVGMFLTQIFVNIGMTIGIMPTTGIPLPFMTYGGSNTITNLAAVGILCAIQIRGGVPLPPPLAAHDVVVNAPRGVRQQPAPLARR